MNFIMISKILAPDYRYFWEEAIQKLPWGPDTLRRFFRRRWMGSNFLGLTFLYYNMIYS